METVVNRVRSAAPRSARPVTLIAFIAVLLFAAAPATASNARSLDVAVQALERSVTFAGTAWGIDTRMNQVLVTVDSTVKGARLATVRAVVQRLGSS